MEAPTQDGLAARAAAAGAWEAVTASGPRWLASIPARAPPSTAHKSRWPTSQSPPGTWPSGRAGRGDHSLTLGNAYFGSFIRTKSLRR